MSRNELKYMFLEWFCMQILTEYAPFTLQIAKEYHNDITKLNHAPKAKRMELLLLGKKLDERFMTQIKRAKNIEATNYQRHKQN